MSHNNITKLAHELDQLTEVVTLDLSTNGITSLNKFLKNCKKLVHLSLSHNRIDKFLASSVPESVSSIDLSFNLLTDVPGDLNYFTNLEHLQMEGNPLQCSCKNLKSRDYLLKKSILIDPVDCASPPKYKGTSWLHVKTKEVCKVRDEAEDILDIMMGDQPIDPEAVGEEASKLKTSVTTKSVLEEGSVWEASSHNKNNDDDQAFLGVTVTTPSSTTPLLNDEGSGDYSEFEHLSDNQKSMMEKDEMMMVNVVTTEDPEEGSGDLGSGFGILFNNEHIPIDTNDTAVTEDPFLQSKEEAYDYDEGSGAIPDIDESPTSTTQSFIIGPFNPFFIAGSDDVSRHMTTEEPVILPERPSVFQGKLDWDSDTSSTAAPLPEVEPSTPVVEVVLKKTAPDVGKSIPMMMSTESPHIADAVITNGDDLNIGKVQNEPKKTSVGTYVCIIILICLLVGLIGFAVVKGQIRKRRDRRLLRQQKRDVEKASKEMVDMNKSLLGKPAPVEIVPSDGKANGKYQLVPTHETPMKKSENGTTEAQPRANDYNQNSDVPVKEKTNSSTPKIDKSPSIEITPSASPTYNKDADSLSSEDIFIPQAEESPKLNGLNEPEKPEPITNGNQNLGPGYLSPSREYVPVYSPDMGRVRIKMTETPKPKTPTLVTRSRSNAGEIIITPAGGQNPNTAT